MLLVAIFSSHRYEYTDPMDVYTVDWIEQQNIRSTNPEARREACRSTWIKDLPCDYKFFLGRQTIRDNRKRLQPVALPRLPLDDEVFLECGDFYHDNSHKMKAICQWALDRNYDHLLKVDDDTYIYGSRLESIDYKNYDYAGSTDITVTYHAGSAMFLSRKVIELIVEYPVTMWAEDFWIGRIMEEYGIPTHELSELCIKGGDNYLIDPDKLPIDHPYAILHSCYPKVMNTLYEREHVVSAKW